MVIELHHVALCELNLCACFGFGAYVSECIGRIHAALFTVVAKALRLRLYVLIVTVAPVAGSEPRQVSASSLPGMPFPPMAGASEDDTPDAQAVLGDAQVIEAGATDASTEVHEDNSTNVTVVVPPAPEAASTEPAAT